VGAHDDDHDVGEDATIPTRFPPTWVSNEVGGWFELVFLN